MPRMTEQERHTLAEVTSDRLLAELLRGALEPVQDSDGWPIDYVPNEHRTVRVAPDYWERMLSHRVRGYASFDGEMASPAVPQTVGVTRVSGFPLFAQYSREVIPVAEFRAERASRTSRPAESVAVEPTEVELWAIEHGMTQDALGAGH